MALVDLFINAKHHPYRSCLQTTGQTFAILTCLQRIHIAMCLDTGLRGAHAIITGGTRGMGLVIVQALLREGVNVSYCARTIGDEKEHFKRREDGCEGQAVGTAVDVSSKEPIQHWVDEAAARFGRIDIVIANGTPHSFLTLSPDYKSAKSSLL